MAGLTAIAADIVSKYVGETENNLLKLFSDEEFKRPALFFDEADALVDKRSKEKDAHDRFWTEAAIRLSLA